MSDQYVAEIRMFGCNFPPKGWAQCNGQLIAISQNTALFSLLGTNYGGDGRSTFGLPNLQGLSPICAGQGSGLSLYNLGQTTGSGSVTLQINQMPTHSHVPNANTTGTTPNPTGAAWANPPGRPGPNAFASAVGSPLTMSINALGLTGGGQPHNNLMPYQVVNYCIALVGEFPPRQ